MYTTDIETQTLKDWRQDNRGFGRRAQGRSWGYGALVSEDMPTSRRGGMSGGGNKYSVPRFAGTDDQCEPEIPGDLDHDGDVDLEDYAIFQGNFTGPR